jgi:hypothetical protein
MFFELLERIIILFFLCAAISEKGSGNTLIRSRRMGEG